ncbi:hypothetical protein V7S43_001849 [Phytophthora oleae]|uniref:Uncharacterized protein n=1 Tax=Phytophthora oleae TaxID=2107226 RepID=A0ABD3G1Q7_9STRA
MATGMATLYERILALVPVNELHGGYNDVLSEEISLTNRAVNDVVAAFSKLQEIREAVRQLQQDSTGTRSASLTETMDATLDLQQKLQKKVELAAPEMTKPRGKRKITIVENCVNESGRNVPKTEVKSEDMVQAASLKQESLRECRGGKVKHKSTAVERNTVDEIGTEYSSLVSGLTVANCLEKLRVMTQLSVVERSKHLPGVLSKLTSLFSAHRETEQISILKYVILWAKLSADTGTL